MAKKNLVDLSPQDREKENPQPSGHKAGISAINVPEDENVTGMERIFCLEYFRTGNAALAARKAGWEKNSARIGANLLMEDRIKLYTKAIMQVHEEQLELDRENFVNMLKYMIHPKVDDFMDDWGNLKKMEDIPNEYLHAVKEVTIHDYKDAKGKVTRTKTTLKLADKLPAMDMWAKIRNFYKENNTRKQDVNIHFH